MATDYPSRLKIPLQGERISLCTRTGLQLLSGYTRVVIGTRGPYVEATQDQMIIPHIHIPLEEMDRLKNESGYYYREYRSNDVANVKIYWQIRPVTYADYMVGLFYVSPFELYLPSGEVVITALRQRNSTCLN